MAPIARRATSVDESVEEAHCAPRASEATRRFSGALGRTQPMDESPSTNPYLSGNYAPVRSEDDYDLEVAGEFPSGLRGVFYRNGPNPQFEPRGHYHWFTGDGRLLRRRRQGRLSQSLRPNAEMGA